MPRETVASVKLACRKQLRQVKAMGEERERALKADVANAEGQRDEAMRQLGERKLRHDAELAIKDARIADLIGSNNCFEQKARDALASLDEARGTIGHLARVVDTLANHKA